MIFSLAQRGAMKKARTFYRLRLAPFGSFSGQLTM
jgi:hypothetical protein